MQLLKRNESKVSSWSLGAKNIKRELKDKFPKEKFSVTSESYSMGNSINIYCKNHSIVSRVSNLVKKYQMGSFDGMTDSYTNNEKEFHKIYGGAKFVMVQRF